VKNGDKVTVIILAAGKGSRLEGAHDGLPKGLIPVGEMCSIDRILRVATASPSVNDVIVVGGYAAEILEAALPEHVTFLTNPDYDTTNSLVSLAIALDTLSEPMPDLVVFNADVVYEENLLWRWMHHPYQSSLLVDELKPYNSSEHQVHVEGGRVRAASNDVPRTKSAGEDAQSFRVSREDLPEFVARVRELLAVGKKGIYASSPLDVLCKRGVLRPVYTNGQVWVEFDTPEDLTGARETFIRVDKQEISIDSYGIDAVLPDNSKLEVPKVDSPRKRPGAIARTIEVWEPRFRRRLKLMPRFFRALKRSPIRAMPYFSLVANGRMKLSAVKLQLFGHELLQPLMEEAAALGIKPMLLWGSLLGCVREGAFLKNDHDVDLGLLADDYDRIEELKERMLNRGFRIRRENTWKISFLHPTVENLWVDLDRIDYENGHFQVTNGRVDKNLLYRYPFCPTIFGTPVSSECAGIGVYIPERAEQFLETVYGDWRVPRPKKTYHSGPLNLRLERRVQK
jgi:choline kinase